VGDPEVGIRARLAGARLTAQQTIAVSRRILTESLRQRRSLIFWAVFPALMLLLFGSMYRSNPSLRAGFDTTPAGILVGAALFFSCLGGTVSLIVAERERRTLRRLLVSPLSPVAYFLGIVLALSVVALLQAVLVYLLAIMLGAKFHGSVWLGLLIVVFSVFSYVGLGFVFGARFARRAEAQLHLRAHRYPFDEDPEGVDEKRVALVAAVEAHVLPEQAGRDADANRLLGWHDRHHSFRIRRPVASSTRRM